MSRAAKLYQQLLNGKRPTFREFEQLLQAFGFVLRRTSGSHHVFSHPMLNENLVIQPRGKDAMPYQVRDFLDKVERYGLTMECDG